MKCEITKQETSATPRVGQVWRSRAWKGIYLRIENARHGTHRSVSISDTCGEPVGCIVHHSYDFVEILEAVEPLKLRVLRATEIDDDD